MSSEFATAKLGDERRTTRLQLIADAFSAAPAQSLPRMLSSEADLEGGYRFINNENVSLAKVLTAHSEKAAERARGCETVLVIHDGTNLVYTFDGELREGFGRFGNQQGIQALVSLAVSFGEGGDSMTRNDDHEPLGVVACQTRAGPNEKKKPGRKGPRKRRGTHWGGYRSEEWLSSVAAARGVLRRRLVHVIDREGDALELFAKIHADGDGFVVRVSRKRRVSLRDEESDDFLKIAEAAEALPRLFEEQIQVERRGFVSPNQTNPPRSARVASLTFAAGKIQIAKGEHLSANESIPKLFNLNLVHVKERDAPEGEEPIEWFLVTREPIGTEEEVRRVVRIYRARWLIEEFFRVLKTGCAIEKRQVESRSALEVILAVSLAVSWRILFLRHKSRIDVDAPASVVFTSVELDLLHVMKGLPRAATLRQALLAVASMGGHLKSNGPPGNVVLARGLEKLETQAEVWAVAMAKK